MLNKLLPPQAGWGNKSKKFYPDSYRDWMLDFKWENQETEEWNPAFPYPKI